MMDSDDGCDRERTIEVPSMCGCREFLDDFQRISDEIVRALGIPAEFLVCDGSVGMKDERLT